MARDQLKEKQIKAARNIVVSVLRMKFESVPQEITELVGQIDDHSILENLIDCVAQSPSLDVFAAKLNERMK